MYSLLLHYASLSENTDANTHYISVLRSVPRITYGISAPEGNPYVNNQMKNMGIS